jgi:thymidylate kinase
MREHCLVVGIDAAGKSTFLKELPENLGYTTLEPAESEEAREFRERTFGLDITPKIIEDRRSLFLKLNERDDATIRDILKSGGRVATTGSRLVTNVSHDIMMQQTLSETPSVTLAVKNWLSDFSAKPDMIVFLHADDEIIRKRNAKREAEDLLETQVGFYGPEFLTSYQVAWFEVIKILGAKASMRVIDYDSGKLSPGEIIDKFVQL